MKKFEDFLKGDSVKVDGRTVTVPDDIKDAFKNTKDSVAKIGETMNGMFSKFKVNGGFKEGFSKTIKENAERMAFWEEGASKAKVGTGEIAMRYGTVGLGTYLAGHALLVDKTRDDESKSVLSRVLEGGAGVLLVGGGLLAGRAV